MKPLLIALGLCAALGAAMPFQVGLAASTDTAAQTQDAEDRAYFTDRVLLTQDGAQVRFYSDVLKEQVVVINFVFTTCDGACPLITHKLLQVREALGAEKAERIRFVSVSIDPERDTPAALKAFAQRQRADLPGWLFLTGASADVEHIVKKLGQYTPDVESHSTLVLAGNVATRHWMKVPPHMPPMAIAERLRALLGEPQIAPRAAGAAP
jgi:protein SCO1